MQMALKTCLRVILPYSFGRASSLRFLPAWTAL